MPGESVTIGDYTLTYERLREERQRDKRIIIADVAAFHKGKRVYTLAPGKAIFNARPNMPTSEIDIKTTPLEDLYVALVSHDPNTQAAAFKVFIAPFTWWFWLGGTILIFGTMLCLWPTREELDVLTPSPRVFVSGVGGILVLALASSAPLALYTYESHSEWSSAERLLAQRDDAPVPRGEP